MGYRRNKDMTQPLLNPAASAGPVIGLAEEPSGADLPEQWRWIFEEARGCTGVHRLELPDNGVDPVQQVWAGFVLFDQKHAQRLLRLNTQNRPVMETRVQYYGEAIQRGEWLPTHQGVALSSENVLLDGQHRLLAIPPDCEVWHLVTVGWPPDVMVTLDRGRARSDANILSLATGVKITANAVATVRFVPFVETQEYPRNLTGPQLETLWRLFGEAASFYVGKAKKRFRVGPVLACAVRAEYRYPRERVAEFFEYEGRVENVTPDKIAASRLVKLMEKSQLTFTFGDRQYLYRLATTALAAFLAGENLQVVRETRKNPFPLPPNVLAELQTVGLLAHNPA